MSTSDENVTHLVGQELEPENEAMASRLNAVALLNDDLAEFVKKGRRQELHTYLQDAAAIADLLAAAGERYAEGPAVDGIADDSIPQAGYLIHRLMRSAMAIEEYEIDQRIAASDSRMEAEAAAAAERRESPAMKVAALAHMNALEQDLRADLLEELGKQAPEIATIVAEYLSDRAHGDAALYVDPADTEGLGVEDQAVAAQAHGRHLVVVTDGDPENVRTWLVGDETAEALQPLAQDAEAA